MCFLAIKVPVRVTHTHSVCEESLTMTHQFVDSDTGSASKTHLTRLEFDGEKRLPLSERLWGSQTAF